MRVPSITDCGLRRAHPVKTGRIAARGHHHGFSRPMAVERLEARLPLDSTPVAGPIPTNIPSDSIAGSPAFQSIAGGDETNQSLAQTSFIAGGPAAGIGPAGAGGSGGIGGGIVETGFTGTEFSPFNLPPGAFGGVHEGVIGEGPESTGNPSNDTRGAGPGAITNPAGSQMANVGFNQYAVAETRNFGFGGAFGPDTGYPTPLPDDALLPRLFPRPAAAPVIRGGQSGLLDQTGEVLAFHQADSTASAADQVLESVEKASPASNDGRLGDAANQPEDDQELADVVTAAVGDPIKYAIDPAMSESASERQVELAQRADRVMAGPDWQSAGELDAGPLQAGVSAQASLMSAALVTAVFDVNRLGDSAWEPRRAVVERRHRGERLGR
jgi:hypothetical protein